MVRSGALLGAAWATGSCVDGVGCDLARPPLPVSPSNASHTLSFQVCLECTPGSISTTLQFCELPRGRFPGRHFLSQSHPNKARTQGQAGSLPSDLLPSTRPFLTGLQPPWPPVTAPRRCPPQALLPASFLSYHPMCHRRIF